MSKLLETRLPFSQGDSVSSDTFNRLIRILELNLGSVDFTISPSHQTYPTGLAITAGVGAVTVSTP